MSTPLLVIILLLALALIVTNVMIAIAFLRGRKDNFKSLSGREDKSIEELHQRVKDLSNKK